MVDSKRGSISMTKRYSVTSTKRGSFSNSGIRKILEMKRKSTLQMNMLESTETISENALTSDADDICCEVEKLEVQPCRVYSFHCGGENIKDNNNLQGKNIEWKATFELPIEEFVYPSLQRYEYDAADDKSENSSLAPKLFYANGSYRPGSANNVSSEGYFVETVPRWSVVVTDENPKKNVISGSGSGSSGGSLNEKGQDLLADIEHKGDAYLRKRLKYIINSRSSQICNSPGRTSRSNIIFKPELSKSERITEETYFDITRKDSENPIKDSLYGNSGIYVKTKDEKLKNKEKDVVSFTSSLENAEDKISMKQKKLFEKIIPENLSDTQEGLLYYRMKNEMRLAAQQKQKIVPAPTGVKKLSSLAGQEVVTKEQTTALSKKLIELNEGDKNNHPTRSPPKVQFIKPRPLELLAGARNILLASSSSSGSSSSSQDYFTIPKSRIGQALQSKSYNYVVGSLQTGNMSDKDGERDDIRALGDTVRGLERNLVRRKSILRTPLELINDLPVLKEQHKVAEDVLLLAQLDAGRIPEEFFQKASMSQDLHVTVDLSAYGIGDTHGNCLAMSLYGLPTLGTLGLSDNRLTSISLHNIIEKINMSSIMHLDLSKNSLTGKASTTMGDFFKLKNALLYLDISECSLTSKEVSSFFKTLLQNRIPNLLEDLNISSNKIDYLSVQAIGTYVANQRICKLKSLNLSCCNIGVKGAPYLASALTSTKSLTYLNLAETSLGDSGAQSIASSLQTQQGILGRGANSSLKHLDLSRNNITGKACFVFANVLTTHTAMTHVNLSGNPVGEAGARSLFRKMVSGYQFKCFILLKDCTYGVEKNMFDSTYPELGSPYILDLCQQYSIALLSELTSLADEDLGQFQFEGLMYKDDPRGNYSPLSATQGGGIVVKSGGSLKVEIGRVPFSPCEDLDDLQQQKIEMDGQRVLVPQGIEAIKKILLSADTDVDKKCWLKLICHDIRVTTVQAQDLIDYFTVTKVVGPSGIITAANMVEYLWVGLLDDQKKFDFLQRNTSPRERREIANSLTFEIFKFNKFNPTGHWRIDLSNRDQRGLFLQIVDINTEDSVFSKYHSGRGDTSQKGNWFNFRNERFNGLSSELTVIDDNFLANIPTTGYLEFDYAGTCRPPPAELYYAPEDDASRNGNDSDQSEDHKKKESTRSITRRKSSDSSRGKRRSSDSSMKLDERRMSAESRKWDRRRSSSDSLRDGDKRRGSGNNSNGNRNSSSTSTGSNQQMNMNMPTIAPDSYEEEEEGEEEAPEITDLQFDELMVQLGLNSRKKLDIHIVPYLLLELQHAAANYYFPVRKVLQLLLSHFGFESPSVKAKVIICMIGRISDLHNFELIMRSLPVIVQNEIISKVGWLNLFNPLKPAFNYILCLKYWDNRILISMLLQMSAAESREEDGKQIKEDPRTEIPLSTLEDEINELQKKNVLRTETVHFSYGEIAERSILVNWDMRKEMLKKCLLGTVIYEDNDDEEEYRKIGSLDGNNLYDVITWYNILNNSKSFTSGPLDLQYAMHAKYGFAKLSSSSEERPKV